MDVTLKRLILLTMSVLVIAGVWGAVPYMSEDQRWVKSEDQMIFTSDQSTVCNYTYHNISICNHDDFGSDTPQSYSIEYHSGPYTIRQALLNTFYSYYGYTPDGNKITGWAYIRVRYQNYVGCFNG